MFSSVFTKIPVKRPKRKGFIFTIYNCAAETRANSSLQNLQKLYCKNTAIDFSKKALFARTRRG